MLAATAVVAWAGSIMPAGTKSNVVTADAKARVATNSLRFVENAGQWDSRGRYLFRTESVRYWVTDRGVVLDYIGSAKRNGKEFAGQAIRVDFVGGGVATLDAVNPKPITTDFITDVKKVTNVKSFGEIWSRNVYPGVDVRSYIDQASPRYDIVLSPNADAAAIKMKFVGASGVEVSKKGDLVLKTVLGDRKQVGLEAFQMIGGKKISVDVEFQKQGENQIGFKLGKYDRSEKLTIDPLIYGSYYGGDDGPDEVHATVSDTDGGVYMTGKTRAPKFPAVVGPYGFNLAGGYDAFMTKLQGDAYVHDYAAYVGGALNDSGDRLQLDPFGNVWIAGKTESSNFPGNSRINVQFLSKTTGTPTGGTFTATYNGVVSQAIPFNATIKEVQVFLENISAIGVGKVKVELESGTGTLDTGAVYRVSLSNDRPGLISITNRLTPAIPASRYAVSKFTDIFLMRFKKSGETLNPLPTRAQFFGGNRDETLACFSIVPKDSPAPTDPVILSFAGIGTGKNPDIPGSFVGTSYYARYTFTETARFVRDNNCTKYFTDALETEIGGLVTDSEGSFFIGGTVFNNGTLDTSVNPLFVTSDRAFENGRLLRGNDMFVRKYDTTGNMIYSVLLGGNNSEAIGGLDYTPEGFSANTGSGIAVDSQGSAYIIGRTNSFNYPRTRGVFGETFNSSPVVVVTKINSDASQIVYSTNLKSNGEVVPAGIAVDLAGNAYVTGNIHPFANFPDTAGGNPADPNQPTSTGTGSITLTGDALDPTYDMPASPKIPTTEGWLTVLNATATRLIYSSYLGGLLDDMVFGPFVDRFGDVWVNGWTDSYRGYVLFSDTGTPTAHEDNASLPGALITPLAFKAQGDAAGVFQVQNLFGLLDPLYFATGPVRGSPLTGAKPTFQVFLQRDGFVIRQRVAFPGVQSLTVTPSSAPGGLGTQLTGNLTLTSAAPVGGAEITFEINNSSASFDATNVVSKQTLTIPAGGTTATVTIFTRPVSLNTPVQLKASYLGSFKIAQAVVIPWFSQLSLTPSEVVGGQESTGTITLAAPAPTGGVTVDLLTDTPSLVSFPNGAQATIPAGQTTGTFKIATEGVVTTQFPTITGSLLGVGKTQTLTVQPISLSGMTFTPSRVAGGTTATGKVTFTGKSGIDFNLKLTLDKGTGGYRFRAAAGSPAVGELILPIKKGDAEATFLLDTVFETINTKRVATAVRLTAGGTPVGEKVNGTIFVDALNMTSFTIDPTTVAGGEDATGTVTIGSPAPEGGVVIILKSSNVALATVPATVTVPGGQTKTNFTISTSSLFGNPASVVINAKRGSVSIDRTLQLKGSTFALSIAPDSVVGGAQNATGTVTLEKASPAGGITVQLTNPNSTVITMPTSVTIAGGSSTATFTITTKPVSVDVPLTISAKINGTVSTAGLTVRAISLINLTITPNSLRPFRNARAVVTLEAPAPKGGTKVKISLDTAVFAVYPTTLELTVPEGAKTAEFTLQSKRFSIPFNTTVTASAGSGSKSVVVTINR